MRKLSIANFLVILAAGFFVFGFLAFGIGYYKWKTRSFLKQLQLSTTVAEIQEWALDEIENTNGEWAELNSIPSFLNLSDDGPPNYVYVNRNDGQPYLVAQWGSGFGHWGLLIGDQLLEYPIDDFYHVEWAPGIHVWQEKE